MKTLLVPLDGTSFAEEALQYLRDYRDSHEVLLLHCLDLNDIVAPPRLLLPGAFAEALQVYQLRMQEYLDRTVERLVEMGHSKVRSLLALGRPVDNILSVAQDEHVNLMVMVPHCRQGVARLVLGSVCHGVMRGKHPPVLLVPAASREPLSQDHAPVVGSLML